MAQELLVSNTVVLARSPLAFVTSGNIIQNAFVNFVIGKYIKRIYIHFKNQNVAQPLNGARINFLDSSSKSYGKWFRNDLAVLNYGLIESSNYIEEFRYFKSDFVAAQHQYSLMVRVENNVDVLQMIFSRPSSSIFYEIFVQDQ